MEKIPTAEEFLEPYVFRTNGFQGESVPNSIEAMKAFAKLHVEAALKEASEKAVAKENPDDYGTGEIWVDKNSILNAYPLTNIK